MLLLKDGVFFDVKHVKYKPTKIYLEEDGVDGYPASKEDGDESQAVGHVRCRVLEAEVGHDGPQGDEGRRRLEDEGGAQHQQARLVAAEQDGHHGGEDQSDHQVVRGDQRVGHHERAET